MATQFTVIVYLKQRKEDILSLVFKKLNLCPFMPASRGVNPLATLHSWSHDKLNLNLINHCLTKLTLLGTSDNNQQKCF